MRLKNPGNEPGFLSGQTEDFVYGLTGMCLSLCRRSNHVECQSQLLDHLTLQQWILAEFLFIETFGGSHKMNKKRVRRFYGAF